MAGGRRLPMLAELWSAWAVRGRSLTGEQWALPTRLDGWRVRDLYAHAAGWPAGFAALLGNLRDAEPTHAEPTHAEPTHAEPTHDSAAALLRQFNEPGGIAGTLRAEVAERARQRAAAAPVGQLVEQFATTGPAAIATARRHAPAVVDYFGVAVLRLDEAVSIGVVEATVHLLDLLRAIGEPPDVPAAGLSHTVAVLARMAPPVDFVEVATGRSRAGLFPVLT